jgi:hypothetical protein
MGLTMNNIISFNHFTLWMASGYSWLGTQLKEREALRLKQTKIHLSHTHRRHLHHDYTKLWKCDPCFMWQGMQYLCSVRSAPSLTYSMLIYIFKNIVPLMQSVRLVRISSVVLLVVTGNVWKCAVFPTCRRNILSPTAERQNVAPKCQHSALPHCATTPQHSVHHF